MAKKKKKWFPHLHIHDDFSVKDGCATVENYADRVVELGGESLAITNHGMAAGFARQYFACKERGIKPIFGMEAYLNEHRLKPVRELMDKLKADKKAKKIGAQEKLTKAELFVKQVFRPSKHAIILAKSREGYRNLVRMSTDSFQRGFYYVPRTDTKFLEEHAEGLVFSTACIGGFIPTMARNNWHAAVAEAERLKGIFGDDFYVEIMMTEYGPQQETNEVMLQLAHEVGARTIITCDVHYDKSQDSMAQDVLLLMRDKKTIADLEKAKFDGSEDGGGIWQFATKDLYWRTLEDVMRTWKQHHSHYYPKDEFLKAIKNTYALAEEVEDIEFDTSLKLPGIFQDPEATLAEAVRSGLKGKIERGVVPTKGMRRREYVDRIKRELGVINPKGFAEYFLILKDITDHARSIGAVMGPGRGSAAGSLVAYTLGITDIDPLKFGLLFERFLDEGRPDPPDIDLDFSPEHRPQIKGYIDRKYPATATIGSYGTFKPRATMKDVGRVFGVDYRETEQVTKPMDTEGDDKTWEQIFELFPEVKRWSERYPEAWSVVEVLKGLVSYRSKSAAGVLVAPASALDEIPMIFEGDGTALTAIPDSQGDGVAHKGRELSRLGYLKMDILGVRNLNIAPRAVDLVERDLKERVVLDAEELDLEDKRVHEVASSADIPGVFQLDTPTTRPIIRTVGVDSFMDLAMITALARPGPLKHSIHKTYASLKRDTKGLWRKGVPEDLVPLLQDSRGLMIMQEDVMHVVQVMGGLTPQEANECRKTIGKKLDPETLRPFEEAFTKGGLERGYRREELAEVWSKIVTFAKYGFNKAHSVAYMLTAYRQLYMLTHYPTQYFAALLAETPRSKKTSWGDENLIQIMRSAMAHGIEVLPPSVLANTTDFDVVGDKIRFGLSKIKGVASAAEYLMEAKPFDSLEELFKRVNKQKVNIKVMKALILSGALDELPFDEEKLIERTEFDEIPEGIERRNAIMARYYQIKKEKSEPEVYYPMGMRSQERELLGLSLSWWSSDEKERIRKAERLNTIYHCVEEGTPRLELLCEVTRAKTHKTARGTMAFLTVADETGTLENVTIWADQWKTHKKDLAKGKIVILRLRRKENQNSRYGRWSYMLDSTSTAERLVESAQRATRRLAREDE